MTPLASASAAETLRIVAFGDSLTAGYGLPQGQDFASRLEAALKKRGHDVVIANAGVSGDTTAGGRARFDWAVPPETDGVILELGANDVLRGIPPKTTRDKPRRHSRTPQEAQSPGPSDRHARPRKLGARLRQSLRSDLS